VRPAGNHLHSATNQLVFAQATVSGRNFVKETVIFALQHGAGKTTGW